ncbi:MAG TPA: hypothetical protein PKG52_05170 [bacterium]|nr:hypothetical protein [bacterium]
MPDYRFYIFAVILSSALNMNCEDINDITTDNTAMEAATNDDAPDATTSASRTSSGCSIIIM